MPISNYRFTLVLLCFCISLSQSQNIETIDLIHNGTPSYYGENANVSAEDKIDKIKIRTQELIAKNFPLAFLKNNLKPNDSIEFDLSYLITKRGKVENINVGTNVENFNTIIQLILKNSPKYKAASLQFTKDFLDFEMFFRPEFFVNENYELQPIIRTSLKQIVINLNKKELDSIFNNREYEQKSFNNGFINFSTNYNKDIKIKNISAGSEYHGLKIHSYYSNLAIENIDLFNSLKPCKNYSSQIHFFNTEELNFIGYDVPPIYPGCEDKKTNNELNLCLGSKIGSLISSRFFINKDDQKNIKGVNRLLIVFKINTDGNVEDIKIRASYKILEKEALRVISSIPKMTPATKNGELVTIPFSIPLKVSY